MAYQKRYYRHVQEMNKMKETYEQELLKTQLEIKEQTMQNISQEIHDNIGQVLSLANLQLTAIELNEDTFASNKINKSMELISQAINDLRDLSKTLNAENIVKTGLKAAIKYDLELIERSGMFTTSLQVSGDEKKFDDSKETIAYRIVQEALNNILKHARASHILIRLIYMEDALSICISDDGKGFDNSRIQPDTGHGSGLKNMISRAQLIHGSIIIQSEISKGTRIELSVPFF